MVVFSHLFHIDRKYSGDPILPDTFLFGMAGVDLFFVISGFIMVYITRQWTGGSWRRLPEFLFARAARIYPLYWIVSLVVLIIYLIRPDAVFSATPGTPDFFKSFLLWPDTVSPLLEVGWTLVHEMSFYLIFALILILPPSRRLWGLWVWGLGVVLGYSVGMSAKNPELAILFSPLSLEFILGGLIAHWAYRETPITVSPHVLIIIAGLLFIMAIGRLGHFPNDPLIRTLFLALPAAMLVLACLLRDQRRLVCPRILVSLGDWSYSLYLTHILILSLAGRLWSMVRIDGPLDNVIALVFIAIAAVGVSALTYRYIEHPLVNAARRTRAALFR